MLADVWAARMGEDGLLARLRRSTVAAAATATATDATRATAAQAS